MAFNVQDVTIRNEAYESWDKTREGCIPLPSHAPDYTRH